MSGNTIGRHPYSEFINIKPVERYTVCVDFDGVIHSYTSPWQEGSIPDPPVPGALEWLAEMTKKFKVVILTTRGKDKEQEALVRLWLIEHGLPSRVAITLEVTNVKPAALIYIDDRAYRFTGDNFPTAQQIHDARPWNKVHTTPEAKDDILALLDKWERTGMVNTAAQRCIPALLRIATDFAPGPEPRPQECDAAHYESAYLEWKQATARWQALTEVQAAIAKELKR